MGHGQIPVRRLVRRALHLRHGLIGSTAPPRTKFMRVPRVTPDHQTELAANRSAEAAEHTKETAARTAVAAQRTEASADRRTELAADRRCSPPSAPTPLGCVPG